MALNDDIKRAVEGVAREAAKEEIDNWRNGLAIPAEITDGPNGSPEGDHSQRVWLKTVGINSTNESSPLWQADNFAGSNQVGKRVLYGTNIYTGKLGIIDNDYTDLGFLENGHNFTDVAEHAISHEIEFNFNTPYQTRGYDPLALGVSNLRPLKTVPGTSSGLTVDVKKFKYIKDGATVLFAGATSISLSSAAPGTNQQRFVAIYLDRDDNKVKTSNGSTTGINSGRPPDPTISASNYIISAYVRLYDGQTAVTHSDIDDMRTLFGDDSQAITAADVPYRIAGALGGGGNASQPTTADDITVTDDVQFKQNVLFGGANGETPSETVEVVGSLRLTRDGSPDWHSAFKNVNTPTFPRLSITGGEDTNDANYYLLIGSAYSSVSADITSGFQINTSYDQSTDSYRSNNYGLTAAVTESTGLVSLYPFSGSSSNGGNLEIRKNDGTNYVYCQSTNTRVGINNTAPLAKLHVGPGTDTPTQSAIDGLYVSMNGGTHISARDSTNNVEMGLIAGAGGICYAGSWTNHDLVLRTNNADRVRVLTGGNVGIGNTNPLKLLHVGPGTDTPTQSSDGIYVSTNGSGAQVAVRDSTNNVEMGLIAGAGGICYAGTWTNHPMVFRTNNTDRMRIGTGGAVFINDTANANMTAGLTMLSTNSNQIFTVKHGSVAHGMTSIMETDTYGAIYPISNTSGGYLLQAACDADDVPVSIRLQGLNGVNADTTTTTTSTAVIEANAYVKSGTSIAGVNTGGNLFAIKDAGTTRYIFQEDGTAYADVAWTTFSDERIKTDIQEIGYGLNEVVKLKPISYLRKDGELKDGEFVEKSTRPGRKIGLLAQDVKEILPELVPHIDNEDTSLYSLNYDALSVVLVQAIKDLKAEIDELKRQ